MYAHHGCLDVHAQELVGEALSEDRHDALLGAGGREGEQGGAVAGEGEGDVGMYEHDALHLGGDVGEFRAVALEELTACGYVEEEVLHEEVGADGTCLGFLGAHLGAFEDEVCADFLLCGAGEEFYLRHGGDAGQRFAPESHGGEGKEVGSLAYLAGGVPLESQTGIGLAHPLAVVHHLEAGASGIDDHHVDAPRAGVDGILHQLFDDGGGALYDFACGYLVGDGIGKELDDVQESCCAGCVERVRSGSYR